LNGEVAKTEYKEELADEITGELRSSLAQRIIDIEHEIPLIHSVSK